MKKRVNITLNLDKPDHKKAYEWYKSQPERERSQAVVNCITGADSEMKKTLDGIFAKLQEFETVPVMVQPAQIQHASVPGQQDDKNISQEALDILDMFG